MTVALTELVAWLKDDVPAVGGTPSDTQYGRAIKAAVAAFSRDSGMRSVATITIVSGTATYDLPAGFQELIRIDDPSVNAVYRDEGTLITSAGLVPVSADYEESFYITGGVPPTITFYPTPTYDTTRDVWYRTEHELATGSYATMDEEMAETILLHAASAALQSRANVEAQNAWSYQQGDVRVSKEKAAGELRKQADAKMAEYRERIKQLNLGVGRRARYDTAGR
jgi:hypothetical protein